MNIVLFGAGAAGRYALRHLREKGIEPGVFADNDPTKWDTTVCGVPVVNPYDLARSCGNYTWVATAISRPAATEIRAQMKQMGVRTKPLWECLPVCHGLPNDEAWRSAYSLCGDIESDSEWRDQMKFRENPDYDAQRDPSPISELYFPPFIKMLHDEHFVDCGACDGDTIRVYLKKRKCSPRLITAFEPDHKNYISLELFQENNPVFRDYQCAVGDYNGYANFISNGDYSSRLGGDEESVPVCTLDKFMEGSVPPTYIKMDIEGAEKEALWGARKILQEHKPVLAICAYHHSEDLWQIPMLIHALQPEYKLFLRRYAEGAFEIVWYAIPADRFNFPIPSIPRSYSDDHVG